MSRSKGSGCLIKRGNMYYARWVVDGQVFTRSTKCTVKRDALKKLEEYVHPYQVSSDIEKLENLQSKIKVLEGEANRTPKDKAVKLKFMIDVYMNDINQSPITGHTEVDYNCKLNRFEKFVAPKIYAYQITEADVDRFMLEIKSRCTEKTYNSYLKVFKRMYSVVMRHDTNIRRNPFSHLKPMSVQVPSYRRELTLEEETRLFEEAKKIGNEEYVLFMLGAYSGLRRSDCMSLKFSDIDFDAKMIRLIPQKTKKTGRSAIIPIVPELMKVLKTLSKTEDDFVFPKLHTYSHWQISHLVETVFQKSGIKIFFKDDKGKKHFVTGFHALRHTVASRLHRTGTPINQIKTILGHSKIDMSLAYAHVEESDLRMPDLTDSTTDIRLKKTTYNDIMSKAREGETFEDVLLRLLKGYAADERAREAIKDIKKKEREEIDKMLDEVFEQS